MSTPAHIHILKMRIIDRKLYSEALYDQHNIDISRGLKFDDIKNCVKIHSRKHKSSLLEFYTLGNDGKTNSYFLKYDGIKKKFVLR